MSQKRVYTFGNGKAEGNAKMREELGGKGANLAEMNLIGVPVPPGFTITTDCCNEYYQVGQEKIMELLNDDVMAAVKHIEGLMNSKFGDKENPLLVSVRSGARASMPGMMDTILNLGLNDEVAEGMVKKTNNPHFVYDSYRRFVQMYGDVVLEMKPVNKEDIDPFEEIIEKVKAERGVKLDKDLSVDELKKLVQLFKAAIKERTGKSFPDDPIEQLWGAICAVFRSWMNERAILYRKMEGIPDEWGTAVSVMAMVFGNMGDTSATGVCFSRDAANGENVFNGEYLVNAQGEDVVAGIRTPMDISALEQQQPKIFAEITKIRNRLEKHYHDMQDMEFTVQEGKLYMLQCRNGKRTGPAAVKMAVDMVGEKLIKKEEALLRVKPDQLDQLLHPQFDAKALKAASPLAAALNASPGAGCGQIVFTAEEAVEWDKAGKKVILVRKETSPDDIAGMYVAQGILTSTGGRTSHAAVVARGMGTPCVCGCSDVVFTGKDEVTIGGKKFAKGDIISIDGSTGKVYGEAIPVTPASVSGDLETFLGWADEVRASSKRVTASGKKVNGFEVLANAEQNEAPQAFRFGAAGIGLCRTEHMFFEEPKLSSFQKMILSETTEDRKKNLKEILPLQKKDFFGIIKAMEGRPVTIRLLDPPLNEFVQAATPAEAQALASKLGYSVDKINAKYAELNEHNPMLGHRGCRLAITYPEIYEMQVEAIALATVEADNKGIKHDVRIMIPNVTTFAELKQIRAQAEAVIASVNEREGTKLKFQIGSMIEFPRAAATADQIAEYADFFSFGTNDLTQTTLGFSRDDYGKFIDSYLDQKVLDNDPFKTLDADGVGAMIEIAETKGRSVKSDLHLGICGEHGGDPASIELCYKLGLNYVSCSPFRVPAARLAGAQAVIKANLAEKGDKKPAKRGPKKGSTRKTTKTAAKKTAEKKTSTRKTAAKKTTARKTTKAGAKKTAKKTRK